MNPSKRLVDYAIDRWKLLQLRADNTSIVTVMLDPPGPPRAQVLRRMYGVTGASVAAAATAATRTSPTPSEQPAPPPQPLDGVDGAKANIAIISRFPNSDQTEEKTGKDLFRDAVEGRPSPVGGGRVMNSSVVGGGGSGDPSRRFIQGFDGLHRVSDNQKVDHVKFKRTPPTPPSQQRFPVIPSDNETGPVPLAARRNGSVASLDPPSPDELPRRQQTVMKKAGVQVAEVSSSNTPPPLPQRNLRNPPASLRKELADLQSNATSVGAIISGFEARRTRQNSGPSSQQQQGSRENKKAAAAAAKTAVTPKAAHTPKVTTPRVLRPRNTPTPSSNVKLLAVSPGGHDDDDEDEGQNGVGGMKRKRGSIESAVASKMLRSGSKTAAGKAAAADRQTPIGIARKNAGATPARLGRK